MVIASSKAPKVRRPFGDSLDTRLLGVGVSRAAPDDRVAARSGAPLTEFGGGAGRRLWSSVATGPRCPVHSGPILPSGRCLVHRVRVPTRHTIMPDAPDQAHPLESSPSPLFPRSPALPVVPLPRQRRGGGGCDRRASRRPLDRDGGEARRGTGHRRCGQIAPTDAPGGWTRIAPASRPGWSWLRRTVTGSSIPTA